MEKNFNFLIIALSTLHFFFIFSFSNIVAHENKLEESLFIKNFSFSVLVKEASPAVVNIFTKRNQQTQSSPLFSDPFFRKFFEEFISLKKGDNIINSLGLGVIFDKRGFIVTNNHVIKGYNRLSGTKIANLSLALAEELEIDSLKYSK